MQLLASLKRKKFLVSELIRYEELMNEETPGTEEYEKLKDSYLEVLREAFPKKNLGDKLMEFLKITLPVGASIFLGVYAYHKNENLESKDGDVWREARRR